jgi:hypothetical protein
VKPALQHVGDSYVGGPRKRAAVPRSFTSKSR